MSSSAMLQTSAQSNLFDESEFPPEVGIYRPDLTPPVIDLPRQEYVPRVLEDRWYQTQALEEIARRFPKGGIRQGGKGEMLVSPTGCGKTSIASRAIGSWLERGERVLILVDLERLLTQMHDDLNAEGIFPLIEKAHHRALSDFGRHGKSVLASMQTLHSKRLREWPVDSFDKIVIDECHEFRFASIFNYFAQTPVLGLTATPIRSDGQSLKKYFHYPYISTLTLREAIEGWNKVTGQYEKPYLSRIKIQPIPAHHIDLSGIKIVGKEFDKNELDRTIWQHTNWIASAILEHSQDRPTWAYFPRIYTAEAVAEALRDMGATAAAYTSKTPNPEQVLKQFERGELQYLCNVNMLIKGVNVPAVECIARVRASLNIGGAIQEIGRGTRNSPQTGKKDCLILEFNFKTGKNQQLVSVIDAILDGDFSDKKPTKAEVKFKARVKERMDQIVKTGAELDVLKALDRAKKELSEEDARRQQAKMDARRAKYERVETGVKAKMYDPCNGLNKVGTGGSASQGIAPATPEQIDQLSELTGSRIDAQYLSSEAAEKRIHELQINKQYRYATPKQVKLMVNQLGCDQKKAQRMKTWEASQWMEARKMEMVHELSSEYGYSERTLQEAAVWEIARMYDHVTLRKSD